MGWCWTKQVLSAYLDCLMGWERGGSLFYLCICFSLSLRAFYFVQLLGWGHFLGFLFCFVVVLWLVGVCWGFFGCGAYGGCFFALICFLSSWLLVWEFFSHSSMEGCAQEGKKEVRVLCSCCTRYSSRTNIESRRWHSSLLPGHTYLLCLPLLLASSPTSSTAPGPGFHSLSCRGALILGFETPLLLWPRELFCQEEMLLLTDTISYSHLLRSQKAPNHQLLYQTAKNSWRHQYYQK